MEFSGLGAGLAALAFWGFLAAVVVGGIWYDIRRREAQQETVRRLIESGREFDAETMDRILKAGSAEESRPDEDMRIAALWVMPVAPGLFLFGLILGSAVPDARAPIVGAAALAACLGVGFWVASRIAARWYAPKNPPSA